MKPLREWRELRNCLAELHLATADAMKLLFSLLSLCGASLAVNCPRLFHGDTYDLCHRDLCICVGGTFDPAGLDAGFGSVPPEFLNILPPPIFNPIFVDVPSPDFTSHPGFNTRFLSRHAEVAGGAGLAPPGAFTDDDIDTDAAPRSPPPPPEFAHRVVSAVGGTRVRDAWIQEVGDITFSRCNLAGGSSDTQRVLECTQSFWHCTNRRAAEGLPSYNRNSAGCVDGELVYCRTHPLVLEVLKLIPGTLSTSTCSASGPDTVKALRRTCINYMSPATGGLRVGPTNVEAFLSLEQRAYNGGVASVFTPTSGSNINCAAVWLNSYYDDLRSSTPSNVFDVSYTTGVPSARTATIPSCFASAISDGDFCIHVIESRCSSTPPNYIANCKSMTVTLEAPSCHTRVPLPNAFPHIGVAQGAVAMVQVRVRGTGVFPPARFAASAIVVRDDGSVANPTNQIGRETNGVFAFTDATYRAGMQSIGTGGMVLQYPVVVTTGTRWTPVYGFCEPPCMSPPATQALANAEEVFVRAWSSQVGTALSGPVMTSRATEVAAIPRPCFPPLTLTARQVVPNAASPFNPQLIAGFHPEWEPALNPAAVPVPAPVPVPLPAPVPVPVPAAPVFVTPLDIAVGPPSVVPALTAEQVPLLPPPAIPLLQEDQFPALSERQVPRVAIRFLPALSDVQIPALSSRQVPAIQDSDVRLLSPGQVPTVSRSQVDNLNSAQVPLLLGQQVPLVVDRQIPSLSREQVPNLAPRQLDELANGQISFTSPSQIRNLDDNDVAFLVDRQLPVVVPRSVRFVTDDGVPALSDSQIPLIVPSQIPSLDPNQLPLLSPSRLTATSQPELLDLLDGSAFPGIEPEFIPTLSPKQVPAISRQQVPLLQRSQVAAISDDQVKSVSPRLATAVRNDKISDLRGEQIPLLPPQRIPFLTTDAIPALTKDLVRDISPNQVSGLSDEQVPNIRPEFIPVLTEDQVQAVRGELVGQLQPQQTPLFVPGMIGDSVTPRQWNRMPPKIIPTVSGDFVGKVKFQQVPLLSAEQVPAIVENQVAALRPIQIPLLAPEFVPNVKASQLAALTPEQLLYISADQIPALPRVGQAAIPGLPATPLEATEGEVTAVGPCSVFAFDLCDVLTWSNDPAARAVGASYECAMEPCGNSARSTRSSRAATSATSAAAASGDGEGIKSKSGNVRRSALDAVAAGLLDSRLSRSATTTSSGEAVIRSRVVSSAESVASLTTTVGGQLRTARQDDDGPQQTRMSVRATCLGGQQCCNDALQPLVCSEFPPATCTCFGNNIVCPPCYSSGGSKKGLYGLLGLIAILPVVLLTCCCLILMCCGVYYSCCREKTSPQVLKIAGPASPAPSPMMGFEQPPVFPSAPSPISYGDPLSGFGSPIIVPEPSPVPLGADPAAVDVSVGNGSMYSVTPGGLMF